MRWYGRFCSAMAAVVAAAALSGCSSPAPLAVTTTSTASPGADGSNSEPAPSRPLSSSITATTVADPTAPTLTDPTLTTVPPDTSPAVSSAEPSANATPPETPAPAPIAAPDPDFANTISDIDPVTAAQIGRHRHTGCPVALSDLRYLTVSYRGFDGADHQGELVVASSVAADVVDIFGELYRAGYPVASLRLVDDFGGSDDDSMAANNSSAFNRRPVTGGGGFSEHSYGTAIDLNPVQNPYLSGSLVLPDRAGPTSTGSRRPASSNRVTRSSPPSPNTAGLGAALGPDRLTTNISRYPDGRSSGR